MKNLLMKKFKESSISILPIMLIVVLLSVFVGHLQATTIMQFILSSFFLIIGMSLFTLGADVAMLPIGEKIGSSLSKSKKIWLMLLCAFILGVIITIAEPDLSVLATQVKSINYWTLILTISVGVGLFIVLSLIRTIYKIPLSILISVSYILIFILAFFVPDNFLPLSFDSGSVTTGPISVPFIMSFGVGLAVVRSVKNTSEESFGMIAMASAGPILMVMILSIILQPQDIEQTTNTIIIYDNLSDILKDFFALIPDYLIEVLYVVLPIFIFFLIFQITSLKLPFLYIVKILIGLIYALVGITLFLTGANFGFTPVGTLLGESIGAMNFNFLLIPFMAIIGCTMVLAEPAVHVLVTQIENVTSNLISKKVMQIYLCVGVSIALVIVAIRALYGVSLLWFLVPIYLGAIILSFIVPRTFTGIAFDSGGVVTGAMATTFVLPLIIGVVSAIGGNILLDAFGTIALIACLPILVILLLGLAYKLSTSVKIPIEVKKRRRKIEIVDFD